MKSTILALLLAAFTSASFAQSYDGWVDPDWSGDWVDNDGGMVVKLRLDDGAVIVASIIDSDGEVFEAQGIDQIGPDRLTLEYYVPSTETTVWLYSILACNRIVYTVSNSSDLNHESDSDYFLTRE